MCECRYLREGSHEDHGDKEDQHRGLSPPYAPERRGAESYQCEYEVGCSHCIRRGEEPRSGRKKICCHYLRQAQPVPESPQRETVHCQVEQVRMEEVMRERHIPHVSVKPCGTSEQKQYDKKRPCGHYDKVSTSSHTSLSC